MITTSLLQQPLVIIQGSKSLNRILSENYKRTRQGVSAVLLSYIYYYIQSVLRLCFYCISYPKVYVSSISAPCVHHVVVMQLTCSLTSSSKLFLTSLDFSSIQTLLDPLSRSKTVCYKTRVWTDFGQGQGQPNIYKYYNYQSTTDKEIGDRHMTWKSCDRGQNGLEELRVQKDREESRRSQGQEMTSRDMGSSWCTHGVHMYSGD